MPFLKRSELSSQKMQMVAARQDHLIRKMSALDVCMYHSSIIVFVNETGADKRSLKEAWLQCQRQANYVTEVCLL